MAHQTGEIQQAVAATIRDEMDGLRTFLDRRIAELSAEIHATVQMVDFSEVNLSEQLSAIRQQIASVVAAPSAATRNSGLELEAVVQANRRGGEPDHGGRRSDRRLAARR
jgi:chemotaxis protein CheZ